MNDIAQQLEEVTPLTVEELRTRQQHEARVSRAIESAVDGGAALAYIKSHDLHRDHGTWERYTQAKWSISPRYADMLIAAAGIADRLPVPSVRVARALGSTTNDPTEVWDRSVENAGGDPTKVNSTHVRAADDELSGEEPAGPEDATEAQLVAEMEAGQVLCNEVLIHLRAARKAADERLKAHPCGMRFDCQRWLVVLKQSIVDHLTRDVRPHAICGYCGGKACDACDRLGYVSEHKWKATPAKHQGRVIA